MWLNIEISNEQVFAYNSERFEVEEGCYYEAETSVKDFEGTKFSAYFAIIFLDSSDKEIARYVKWLNNFSMEESISRIICRAPNNAKYAVAGYRINTGLARKGHIKGVVNKKIMIKKLIGINFEDYDNILDALREESLSHLRDLSEEEENKIEKNLIWVFGCGRSGSSWLVMKLLDHPEIIRWNEPLLGLHLASSPAIGGIPSSSNEGAQYIINVPRTYDIYQQEIDYIFSYAYKDIWRKYLRKLVMQRLYAQYPDCINKKVVIKEPNGSYAADVIMEVFSFSKIIFLARDGRDVVDSKLDIYQKNTWAQKWINLPSVTSSNKKWLIISESNIWRMLMETANKVYKSMPAEKNC